MDFDDLPKIASENPARLLNLEKKKGRIAPGFDADLTLFRYREEGPLEIVAVMRSGSLSYVHDDAR
jgi:dihydroorotase-like cyclic amidohydrolase